MVCEEACVVVRGGAAHHDRLLTTTAFKIALDKHMTDSPTDNVRATGILGLDAEATPLLGLGLGLTGLALGLRPRLAPLPLALTALAALLYRDPERSTPKEAQTLFAVADGVLTRVDEVYEHRFVHSDCLRISTISSPLDVPLTRSPCDAEVCYVEAVRGDVLPVLDEPAAERNERLYIGLTTSYGPMLLVHIAGPLVRRIICRVAIGDSLAAGERLSSARFGARVELFVQRDVVSVLPQVGTQLCAGISRLTELR
jgi:phosphatidylserine decarboxylase